MILLVPLVICYSKYARFLDTSNKNCEFDVCPPGKKCCKGCDMYGNQIQSGKCIDHNSFYSECPDSICRTLNKGQSTKTEDFHGYIQPPVSDDSSGNSFQCTSKCGTFYSILYV